MDKHRKALELAGHAGCILLKNGAEIFRVQETMIRILCAYGVSDHNVYVISNGIFATEGEGTDHALSLVRHVPLGGVNLSRIDAVNAVSREICAGKWSMDEAEAALTRVETLTPERPITHIFACMSDSRLLTRSTTREYFLTCFPSPAPSNFERNFGIRTAAFSCCRKRMILGLYQRITLT